jgi:hypothetical protein
LPKNEGHRRRGYPYASPPATVASPDAKRLLLATSPKVLVGMVERIEHGIFQDVFNEFNKGIQWNCNIYFLIDNGFKVFCCFFMGLRWD